jgi:S1-C subfamily serine protease
MEVEKPGLNILTVIPGSPAVKAGVKPGDRLVAINGKPINSVEDYREASQEWEPTRVYDIVRGNQLLTLTLHFPKRDSKPVNHAEIIALLQTKEEKPN